MARDYAAQPYTAVRRDDRAVNDETWMKTFLHHADVGTLATVYEGQPFVNTNLFYYDEVQHCVYIHTARVGRTRANIDAEQNVCFSIMEMGRLLPADEALEFSVEYAGVTIFGKARVIDEEAEATVALQALLDKYAPHLAAGEDYRPPIPEELKRTSVFRIDIDDWSAKKKEVEADFPGAYWYEHSPILKSVCERVHWQGRVTGIYISSAPKAPMQPLDSVEAVAGKGLVGDRYFNSEGTFSGQGDDTGRDITLVAAEAVDAVNQEGNLGITPADTRRNIVTEGVSLNDLVGKKFAIGEVILQGVRLCEPCDHLAKVTGKGGKLTSNLVHRGGLRADIVQNGVIRAGDVIRLINEQDG